MTPDAHQRRLDCIRIAEDAGVLLRERFGRPGEVRDKGDITSANIFESILEDEEHHIDYLDTQLELLEKLGEALYIAQLIEQPES